ncbi:hypothetical protein H8S07_09235 [Dorea sp. NSJ-36]|uniref:Transposase (putative) YhgA-like domain-containing protein n=1 Tax=Dorea hominis TaxID=2763040 RepID=A0ABR7EWU0_9FIRM|nr:hypothetical protein [Dorea hominis]MBC5665457.1 hypothetical protein [Dorea hominis]
MRKNREYKSDVFSMLMESKENALEIYNALNDSGYTNPEDVEIVQLERGVSLSIRNDASFIIDMNINFYEHQSTYNPNMPLRSLIYFVNALEDWLKDNDKDLFSRKQIQIPTPHFVIFYNGMQKRPEYEEMRLSNAFYHKVDEPQIEIICKVYNINPENNQILKKKSTVLEGYTYFVEKVRENQRQGMNLEEAVDSAIKDCIDNHILEDFFRRRKDDVKKMTHLDYTWEKRERLIRMEEYADGEAAGIQKGKIDSLLEILQELGDIPEALQNRIRSEKDLQVLTSWLKAAARADSVEEFQAKAGLL